MRSGIWEIGFGIPTEFSSYLVVEPGHEPPDFWEGAAQLGQVVVTGGGGRLEQQLPAAVSIRGSKVRVRRSALRLIFRRRRSGGDG